MKSPTIATTTTITTTFGSANPLATTSAAAMLRCAVPSASTLRVSRPGPPKSQPVPKPSAMSSRPARMPPVPNTLSTLRRFAPVIATMSTVRLRLETRSRTGLMRPASAGSLARPARPMASGNSISKSSERAIFNGSTVAPGSRTGSASGK